VARILRNTYYWPATGTVPLALFCQELDLVSQKERLKGKDGTEAEDLPDNESELRGRLERVYKL
jgi:hypothetical protein